MPLLVLDSGGVTWLAAESQDTLAYARQLRLAGLWPPVIPSAVLVECLAGDGSRDAKANRLIKACDVEEAVPVELARRAASLRTAARRGSAVDALVVMVAEPGGTVLTGDPDDLRPLAAYATNVSIQSI